MQRRWITLAGAGMAVVAAGLSMLLVLLPAGGQPRPAAWKGIAFVPFPHPVWHLAAAAPAQTLCTCCRWRAG